MSSVRRRGVTGRQRRRVAGRERQLHVPARGHRPLQVRGPAESEEPPLAHDAAPLDHLFGLDRVMRDEHAEVV